MVIMTAGDPERCCMDNGFVTLCRNDPNCPLECRWWSSYCPHLFTALLVELVTAYGDFLLQATCCSSLWTCRLG